jgi:hypothetical protein
MRDDRLRRLPVDRDLRASAARQSPPRIARR